MLLRTVKTANQSDCFSLLAFSPIYQINSERNEISLENSFIELFETEMKLDMASLTSWPRQSNRKSINLIEICLEPYMTEVYPVSFIYHYFIKLLLRYCKYAKNNCNYHNF